MRDIGDYWGIPGIWAIFAGAGVVSILGGGFASDPRQVLFALGITGLFAGLLTYLVTPRHFVHATTADQLHDVLVKNLAIHVPCVERQCERTYIPQDEQEPGDGCVLLFFSCEDEHQPGVSVYPTGDALLGELVDHARMIISDSPAELSRQIADGLENGLELVEDATCVVDPLDRSATVQIEGSVVGTIGQFDDPVTSFVGTAFAFGLDQPTKVTVHDAENDRVTISCQWMDKDNIAETIRTHEKNHLHSDVSEYDRQGIYEKNRITSDHDPS